jgi:hypothetical protein
VSLGKDRGALGSALLLSAAFICAAPARGLTQSLHAGQERRWKTFSADTAWTVTADSRRQNGLVYPTALAVLPKVVVALDASMRRVLAFSRGSGRALWTAGPSGRGADSFGDPRSFAALPSGDILVSDAKLGALVSLSGEGDRKWIWESAVFKTTDAACAVDDTTLLATTTGGSGDLVRIDLRSRKIEALSFPWRELAGSHELLKQGVFTSARGAPCTFLLTVGKGMATFDRNLGRTLVEFVEQIPAPSLVTTRRRGSYRGAVADIEEVRLSQLHITTMSATAHEACVWVLFIGSTLDGGHILDAYDSRQAAYVASYRIPVPLKFVARDGEDLFVIGKKDGLPYLQRLRIKARRTVCGEAIMNTHTVKHETNR